MTGLPAAAGHVFAIASVACTSFDRRAANAQDKKSSRHSCAFAAVAAGMRAKSSASMSLTNATVTPSCRMPSAGTRRTLRDALRDFQNARRALDHGHVEHHAVETDRAATCSDRLVIGVD